MKSVFLFLIGMMVPFSEFLAQNSEKNEFIYIS